MSVKKVALFKRAHAYGDSLNSYDVLKIIALLTMVVDHLGYYIWVDTEWLRAIGRVAFPLFLFLVGYSGVWRVNRELVVWAGLIVLCTGLTHHPVFPLDILVTILVTRLVMAWYVGRGKQVEPGVFFLACLLWYPLFYWYAYSTMALLFAMCGYLQRHAPAAPRTLFFLYAVLALYYLIEQYVIFQFHAPALTLMVAGALAVTVLLRNFRLHSYGKTFLPGALCHGLLWVSRNTLPLYALHIMLLMIIERICFPWRLVHFQWY